MLSWRLEKEIGANGAKAVDALQGEGRGGGCAVLLLHVDESVGFLVLKWILLRNTYELTVFFGCECICF